MVDYVKATLAALAQGYRSHPFSICFCAEVQLACLYKTKSCEVKAAARRSIIDVVRVAAEALCPCPVGGA